MMQTVARLAVVLTLAVSFAPLAHAQQPAAPVATPPAQTTQSHATKKTTRRHRRRTSSTTATPQTSTVPTLKTHDNSATPPAVSLADQRENQKAQRKQEKANAKAEKARLKAIKKSNKAILAARSYGAMSVPKNQTVLKH